MKAKRLALACLSVFLFVFIYDFVLHMILLKTDYVVTGYLWRPRDEMGRYFGSLLFGQIELSIAFCLIYALFVNARTTVRRGVMYGLLTGLLLCGPNFIAYAIQPFPLDLVVKWTFGRLVQMSVAGVLLGVIYRPAAVRAAAAQAVSA